LKSENHKQRRIATKLVLDIIPQQICSPVSDHVNFNDCLPNMEDVLLELSNSLHSSKTSGSKPSDGSIQWCDLPPSLNMTSSLGSQKRQSKERDILRFERKKKQCEVFAKAIATLNLPTGTTVVDFGCGSCGLTLPLAWSFPRLNFIGVDLKVKSLQLMEARAKAAGLSNIRTVCRSIASFDEPFGLAIALHACGQASDEAIIQAVCNRAPYLVAPCCIGQIRFSFKSLEKKTSNRKNPEQRRYGDGQDIGFINRMQLQVEGGWTRLTYPRSKWLLSNLGATSSANSDVDSEVEGELAEDRYALLSAAADLTEPHSTSGHSVKEDDFDSANTDDDKFFNRTCSTVVGLDRNAYASENAGYVTRLRKMQGIVSGKTDILIGFLPKP